MVRVDEEIQGNDPTHETRQKRQQQLLRPRGVVSTRPGSRLLPASAQPQPTYWLQGPRMSEGVRAGGGGGWG